MSIVDVWMQDPTLRRSNDEMFDSLKRWMGMPEQFEEALPLEMTIAAMDEARTNYPMMTGSRALARLDDLGLDDDVAADFPSGNARQVFDLD